MTTEPVNLANCERHIMTNSAATLDRQVMPPAPSTSDGQPKPAGDSNPDTAIIERLGEARDRVKLEMAKVVVGQDDIIEALLIGLLCRGHVLLLGVPGLGKTLMARTLARTLDMQFRRVQFTPDLMPS